MAAAAYLFNVRSQLALELDAYYQALIDKLDATEWVRENPRGVVRVSSIGIPARVYKEGPRSEERRGGTDDDGRARTEQRGVDPERAKFYEEPRRESRTQLVTWESEFPYIHKAVILGAPGGGKTFLSSTIIIRSAGEALDQLRQRSAPIDSLVLPLHLKAEDLAAAGEARSLPDAVIKILRNNDFRIFSINRGRLRRQPRRTEILRFRSLFDQFR
jgi:hypothetical protein